MPSLKNRVSHQRDVLMGHGPGIRLRAHRIHMRMRRPVVLIPAFLAGMLVARGAPAMRKLPKLIARMKPITEKARKLYAIVSVGLAVSSLIHRNFGAEADQTSNAPSGSINDDSRAEPPAT